MRLLRVSPLRVVSTASRRGFRPGLELLEDRVNPVAFGYAIGLGSSFTDQGRAVTADAAGNVYMTGSFTGTVDFDTGAGTTSLASAGADDVFIAKYSITGALVWARSLGGTSNDFGYDITLDAAGNVYTIGSYQNTADFDPGAGTFNLTSNGAADIFICKLDSSGNFVWAVSTGGSGIDEGVGIAVDAASNVYYTGYIRGPADLDPGPGTFNVTNIGLEDYVVSRLDSSGSFIWANRMGSGGNDVGNEIDLDSAGNVYVSGFFTGTVDFDPGAGTFLLTSAGQSDVFLAKYDNAGNFVWTLQMGGSGVDAGQALALDAADNIYISGPFSNTVDFDPGAGTFNLTSAGFNDVFIARYDSSGNFVWAGGITGTGLSTAADLGLDAAGNVYTIGGYRADLDCDPGAGTFTLNSLGGLDDIFVVKLDSGGNFVWAVSVGGPNSDSGNAIAVTASGTIFTSGYIGGPASDFDPGPGTATVSYVGGVDIFLSKLAQGVAVLESAGSTDVTEGGTSDTYTAVLSELPTADVVVTMTPDPQVNLSTTLLTFTPANWNIDQTVTVTPIDDATAEGVHNGIISFVVTSADTNFNLAPIADVTARITDNESAGVALAPSGASTDLAEGGTADTYTVVLTSLPAANVTITFNAGSQVSGPSTLVFTTVNWNVPQTVTLTAVDDANVEGAHTGIVTQSASSADATYNAIAIVDITANITDNDFPQGVNIVESGGSTAVAEGGLSDSYTVVLNSLPTANVVVTLNFGTQLVAGPSPLTFTTANWNVPQTVSLQAVDDAIAQGTRTAAITAAASSADAAYNGIAIAAVTATITDNDAAGFTYSTTTVDVNEGGTSNTYSVRLNSQPTANVVVALSPNSQITIGLGTLVFTPVNWNTPQVVTVLAVEDNIAEGTHNGLIAANVASADAGYSGLAAATVTVRITDNDDPGILISQSSLSLLEGTSKTFTAVLTSPPLAAVVVTVAPDAELTASPATLTFTPTDWFTPRPVVLTAAADGTAEGDHLGVITLTSVSTDPVYNNLAIAGVTAHIVDVDGSSISGTDRNDQILVAFTPDRILVTINGKMTSLPGTLDQLMLLTQAGNDNIHVTNPTIPIVVAGGPGVDRVFVTGQSGLNHFVLFDSSLTANGQNVGVWEVESLTINGRAEADVLTVQSVPTFAVEFKGDAGNDRILGPARPNSWQVTAANGGTLNKSIKITTVENWTGGTSADSFAFAAGKSLTGTIDGGTGENVLDFAAYTAPVTVNVQTSLATGSKGFANISKVIGGKGAADRLIAADQSNLWNVTAPNTGSVNGLAFQNIENLTGGNQDDLFLLADGQGVKGKIDGAGGLDVLDYTGYLSKPVTINLQAKTATNLAGFLNLEEFQGGSGLTDVLIGPNLVNGWQLDNLGSGSIVSPLASRPSPLIFGNFENLTGGTLGDAFTLGTTGDWFGTLNGGSGTDILTASTGRANTWVNGGLNAGTLNGRKFSGIESRR